MATLKAQGKMTRPLVVPYEVGDHVMLIFNLAFSDGLEDRPEIGPGVGDTGTIRRISISDPNDGDDTFPLLHVEWASGPFPTLYGGRAVIMSVGPEVVIPWPRKPKRIPRVSKKVRLESEAWLRQQLAGLQ